MLAHRGLEYYIILNKEYDYFDIIPDLEKITRQRLHLEDRKFLKIIPMEETDDRLVQSDYYLHTPDWFHFSGKHMRHLTADVIKLTDNEKQLIDSIKNFLHNDIHDEGWFDIAYFR
jgi:hypothetical protein